ncbi:MAG TPA: GNAT family N-acetyltransferase [Candidatus Dormibacteraeota bacterium]|nr:GNAT family N-acetyltransferase [Candidatus Dormibacteraeota bacterium]HEX2681857.1 GNAT family N-acetyltransferase [Candidatus Dormibacteraeota bacterium]
MLSVLASAEEQAASVEANLAAIQAHYATEVFDRDGVRFCYSGLRWRVLNGAVLARLQVGDAEPRIQDVLAWFHARSVPWRWIVGPRSSPDDLGQRLVGAGMRAASDHPGMVLRLDRMRDEPPDLRGLDVHEVLDRDDFDGWADVQRDTWGLTAESDEAWRTAHLQLGFGRKLPLRNYVALLDGKPVGGAAVFFAEGVAGIYNVAVLPEARGKGIGREVTLAALRDARELGFSLSTLGSSDLGLPVYLRIGYEEVCRIRVYVVD